MGIPGVVKFRQGPRGAPDVAIISDGVPRCGKCVLVCGGLLEERLAGQPGGLLDPVDEPRFV
jgi:hypothetical protein